MVTTVNASTSTGLVSTADTSGIIKLQSNGVTTNAQAWGNFNGNPTLAVRATYNVTSITRTSIGFYTVNFTNAMADTNYVVTGIASYGTANGTNGRTLNTGAFATTSIQLQTSYAANTNEDEGYIMFAVFGN
jgi:hypothetical protein